MCLFLGACQEDVVDEFTPVEEKWDSLSDFIESTESEKTITIPDVSDEFVVELNKAIIKFPKGSVKNPLTSEIPTGAIEIKYIILDTYKDLFFSNLHTVATDNEVLYANFIIKVVAKQGNTTLEIDANNPPVLYLETPDNEVINERVFYWEQTASTPGWFLNGNIDVFQHEWDFNSNGQNYSGKGFKMYIRGAGYHTISEHEFLIHTMANDYSPVEIEISQNFKNSETKIFLARNNQFSLIPLENFNGKYVNSLIKKDEPVTIFGVTVVDEKLYFGKKIIIVEETNEYSLSFNESSYVEIIEELRRI
jgi:hypothetical protein